MDPPLAKLKLDAFLAEVRVKYGELEAGVNAQVDAIKNAVMQIPKKKVSVSLARGFINELGVPRSKAQFEFKRPESLTLVGSYANQTMAKPGTLIDLAIRIPKACFYEKDFLNHRYHAKRALYLAYLCKHLRKLDSVEKLEWSFVHEDPRKPVLIVHPVSGAFQIRLLPTISESVFDLSKLASTRNNVRDAQTKEKLPQPTPNYNGSILEDVCVEELSAAEKNLLQASGALQVAAILMKVWLRQRSCYDKADTLNGFLLSMLMLHLSSKAGGQRLTKSMTALQMFRVLQEFIAKELSGKGFKPQFEGTETLPALKITGLFLEKPGVSNMSFRMTASSLAELKSAAECTLGSIKISGDDFGFQESFLTAVDFSVSYDYHISISNLEHSPAFLNDCALRTKEEELENVLTKALKERATLVRVIPRGIKSGWSPNKGVNEFVPSKVNVGVLLSDYDTAFRLVDIGPSADNKAESSKFRSFWGKKAELRRFRDGTISETVGWECEPWKRHLIISHIAKYILHLRLSIPEDHIEVVSDQLDFALLDNSKDPSASIPKIQATLEAFTRRLKELSLPLKVSSVQPLSSAFRQTAAFPPQPRTKQKAGYMEPLDVMIQLEGSGRWPSDPVAIQKTKAAFCLKIADSVQKQWQMDSVVSEDAVDILMDGFAFRIHLYYEDSILLEKAGVVNRTSDLITRSVHSSMLNGLNGRFPAYGPTVRLVKRWIGAHLLSSALTEEAAELLVAYTFIRPHPMPATCSRITGFLRFLRLLGKYDWNFFPLIVDINGDISFKNREEIMSRFKGARKGENSEFYGGSSDGPAMFIATSYDKQSFSWTDVTPSKQSLKRLIAYAKSSAALLSGNVSGNDTRWQSIFRTPLTCYTAVIQLQKQCLPHPGRALFPVEMNKPALISCPFSEKPAVDRLLIGFNPVLAFVDEIKASFGDTFEVWYDALGGDVIGVTLKSEAPGSKRKRASAELKPTLQQIAALGHGLVYKIFLC